MKEQITVMIKEPGENWERREIDNTLKAFRGIIGGHIETVQVREDLLLVVDEEGVLKQLDPNLYMRGYWLRGTIIAVGVKDKVGTTSDSDCLQSQREAKHLENAGDWPEKDFADCPISNSWQMRIAIGIANARK